MKMTPEQQIALIQAKAAGKKIEWRRNISRNGKWRVSSYDFNFQDIEYRVVPDDVVLNLSILLHSVFDNIYTDPKQAPNIKFTFDAETRKLKSVTMI